MKYIRADGRWVPADEWAGRSSPTGVSIIRDFAEPLLCHADGKLHGSKRSFDDAVRAAGCEIVSHSEARRMLERPARPAPMESPRAMLRELVNR